MTNPGEIAARLRRYYRTSDLRDLWPDLPGAEVRRAMAAIARTTGAVLAGGSSVSLAPRDVTADGVSVAAAAGAMGPLLGWWIETGRVNAPAALAARLAEHLAHGRRRAARMRERLEWVLGALGERGVDAVLLKGMHTAWEYFPEPGVRPSADMDLLVAPREYRAARDRLGALGFLCIGDLPQRSTWMLPGCDVVRSLEMAHADNPWSVDLHVTLDRGAQPSGAVPSLGAAPDGVPWSRSAVPVRVLPQPHLLAYLCLHSADHLRGGPLIRLVELVLVARRDYAGPAAWDAFRALVHRERIGRFVWPALDLAARLAPGAVEPATLEQARAAAPRGLRWVVRRMAPGTGERLHPVPFAMRFAWVATPGELVAVVRGVVWPSGASSWRDARRAIDIRLHRMVSLFSRMTRAMLGRSRRTGAERRE